MAFGGPALEELEHHFHCVLLLSHQSTQTQGQGHGPTSPWRGVCSCVVTPSHGDILYGPVASNLTQNKTRALTKTTWSAHPSATQASLPPPSSSIMPSQPPQLLTSLSVKSLST